jgi:Cytochrome P460
MKHAAALLVTLWAVSFLHAESESPGPAPTTDRVGFPTDYEQRFTVLRTVNKPAEHKVVTVYGNTLAASITNRAQLPYPYGSVLAMETATVLLDPQGEPMLDAKGVVRKKEIVGLHVSRRESGFGEAYGKNRAGEWEFVEYKPDGTYITPPNRSASCAKCHVKAGVLRDFVYRGRLAIEEGQ